MSRKQSSVWQNKFCSLRENGILAIRLSIVNIIVILAINILVSSNVFAW